MGLDPRRLERATRDPAGAQSAQISDLIRRLETLERAVRGSLDCVPGDIKVTAKATPDVGWLLCNGAAVSRITYAALFDAIGTVAGTGDGSTTFNLPDLRGRTIVGAGAGPGLTARTLGALLGEEAHLQAASELHPHSHTLQDSGGFSPDITDGTISGAGTGIYRRALFPGILQTTLSGGVSPGVWNPMNVMQPSTVLSVVIRY